MRIFSFGIVALSLALMVTPAQAVVATFDAGAVGGKDATIIGSVPNTNFDSTAANPSVTHVDYTALEVTASNDRARSLIEFDVDSLSGLYDSIDSITLRLTTSYNTGQQGVVNLHQALAEWVENEVTYNMRDASNPWATAGGDFAPTVLGSINFAELAAGGFDEVREQVTVELLPGAANAAARKALIDSWTSGSNFGLLAKADIEPGVASYNGFRDRSRTDSFDRPMLTVDYTPIPEPAALSLLGLGGLALVRRRRR